RVWYASTLFLHVVNTVLVHVLVVRLTGRPGLAVSLAALWGVSRVHENTIGWYGAFGHALATTALLVAIVDLLGVRRRGGTVSLAVAGRSAVLLVMAGTSFGAGLAAAAVFPLVFYLVVGREQVDPRARVVLGAVLLGLGALYVIVHVWWPLGRGGIVGAGVLHAAAPPALDTLRLTVAFWGDL